MENKYNSNENENSQHNNETNKAIANITSKTTREVKNISIYNTKRFQVVSIDPPYSIYHHITAKNSNNSNSERLCIYLDINCKYTIEIIKQSLKNRNIAYIVGPCNRSILEPTKVPSNTNINVQWREYERIDWNYSFQNNVTRTSSYKFRKGLSRKAQLCHYTSKYIYKDPNCLLSKSIPHTMILQTWSLFEDQDQDGSVLNINTMNWKEKVSLCLADVQRWISDEEDEYYSNKKNKKNMYPIWILKPSSGNKGDGIRVINCMEEVQEAILDNTDIREWVLQKYISNPLLLSKRKFHIRAYVLAVNTLQVYFYNHVLFLRSALPYTYNPTSTTSSASYLSNTFQQKQQGTINNNNIDIDKECVLLKDQLYQILLKDKTCNTIHECKQKYKKVLQDMHNITNEIFDTYKNERDVFEPMPLSFEQYGFDFMIDDCWNVFLLEINPGPDFQQTGFKCRKVIEGFMEDTIDIALLEDENGGADCTLVFDYDCGR